MLVCFTRLFVEFNEVIVMFSSAKSNSLTFSLKEMISSTFPSAPYGTLTCWLKLIMLKFSVSFKLIVTLYMSSTFPLFRIQTVNSYGSVSSNSFVIIGVRISYS